MQPTPIAQLALLLVSLFSSTTAMRNFVLSFSGTVGVVNALPGGTASLEEMGFAIATDLEVRGLISDDFFSELVRARRFRFAEIQKVASAWGIDPIIQAPPRVGGRKRGMVIVSLFFVFAAYTLVEHYIIGRSAIADPVIIDLDPGVPDRMTIRVVSRLNGKSWSVSLSRHRVAQAAARDIFHRAHIDSLPIHTYFDHDDYRLCQEQSCYEHQTVGEAIRAESPVYVERRKTEFGPAFYIPWLRAPIRAPDQGPGVWVPE